MNKKKHLLKFILILAVIVGIASCEKDNDSRPDESLVYDGITITQPTLWEKTKHPHIIKGTVTVMGTTLTIEPGAVVKFENEARLLIRGDNARLLAQATQEENILFTSVANNPAAGDWNSIEISGTNAISVLDFCILEYGGSSNIRGMLTIDDALVSITNSIVRHSGSFGIFTNTSKPSGFAEFMHNEIYGTVNAPVIIAPNFAHTIGEENIILSDYGIAIKGSTYTNQDETWKAQTVPFVLEDDLTIRGPGNPILRLQPGITLLMRNGKNIIVGGNSNYGSLIAQGTPADTITITSFSVNPQPGDWGSIRFDDGATNSVLEFCRIEYGGTGSVHGMINVNGNALVSIKNTYMARSNQYELRVGRDNGSNGFVEFTGNTIISVNGDAMLIRGQVLQTLGEENTFEVPENAGIRVSGYAANVIRIMQDASWKPQTAPYIMEDVMRIFENATLTIQPGVVLKFISGKHIEVGYNNTHGRLIAQGTEEHPIVFTSASPVPQKGDWQGIRFSRFALEGSLLEYCDIGYAGPSNTYKANIIVDPCGEGNPVIKNCNIHNSLRYGIYLNKFQGAWGDPVLENNTFSNNSVADIGEDN